MERKTNVLGVQVTEEIHKALHIKAIMAEKTIRKYILELIMKDFEEEKIKKT